MSRKKKKRTVKTPSATDTIVVAADVTQSGQEDYVASLTNGLSIDPNVAKASFIIIQNKIGYEKAIEALLKAADQGNGNAQNNLGYMYHKGFVRK